VERGEPELFRICPGVRYVAKVDRDDARVAIGHVPLAVIPIEHVRLRAERTSKAKGDLGVRHLRGNRLAAPQWLSRIRIRTRLNAKRTRFSRIHTEVFYGKKADDVGHCVTLSVRSMVARDSFFLRVSIGSGAIPAPLSPARNPTGPPN
jgi:hypothetical protein